MCILESWTQNTLDPPVSLPVVTGVQKLKPNVHGLPRVPPREVIVAVTPVSGGLDRDLESF